MEGCVYLCSWTKQGDQFRLWAKRQPSVAAEGASFDEANERLWGAICGAYGHLRLSAQIPGGARVVWAWHGQALMQRAAARWIKAL